MNYTGIKVTENASPAVATSFIKIANGVHDIMTLAADDELTDGVTDPVLLTSITVDTTNYVVSGYDVAGNRYIIDKQAEVSLTLMP